ncbi:hypothetical protein JOM56_015471 [Amanita muscaria]
MASDASYARNRSSHSRPAHGFLPLQHARIPRSFVRPFQALLARVLSSSRGSSPSPSMSSSSLLESASDGSFQLGLGTKGHFIKPLHIDARTMDRRSPEDLRIAIPPASLHTQTVGPSDGAYTRTTIMLQLAGPLLKNFSTPLSTTRVHCATSLSVTTFFDNYLLYILLHLHLLYRLHLTSLRLFHSLFPVSNLLLKLPLDNPAFSAPTPWPLPSLQNVCVISGDLSYAPGQGFCPFFRTHGYKLPQLEPGHSCSVLSEYIATIPVADDLNNPHAAFRSGMKSVRLAEWRPSLVRFICSACAEWNWEIPDWIVPHILLPSHPNLEMIDIREGLQDGMHAPIDNPFIMLLRDHVGYILPYPCYIK